MTDQTTRRQFDVVICDIDGCLSPETSAPMDASALAKIAAWNRKAIEAADRPVVTLCSGRPQPFVEAMCRLIGNDSLPCIAENGVWIYHPDSNHYDLDPQILPEHLSAIREAEAWLHEKYAPLGVVQQPGKHAAISLYHQHERIIADIMPDLRPAFEERSWPIRVSRTWFYINCDLKHISKGTALDRFFKITGISRDRAAGIGDTIGDAAIADRVAWFACPANASDEIKPKAAYISKHAEADGVLDILAKLR